MANNDNFEEKEIQSDDPIIQKCLDIILDKRAWVEDLCDNGIYSVYIGRKKYFQIQRCYNSGTKYNIDINYQTYKFYGSRPDLEELYRLCNSKYADKSKERLQNALDFLRTKEQKTDKKHLTSGQRTGIVFMLWGLSLIAVAVIDYINNKKTQRVNKQVEAYEKTLPADYLEYKQAVEHYRDSLMHAKGRSK